MTRITIKNKINKILRETTAGLHSDDCWSPVYASWDVIREAGFDLNITGATYQDKDDDGIPTSKVWTFEIDMGSKKPIYGILTAHGAGTVEDPLCKYDISAYVS